MSKNQQSSSHLELSEMMDFVQAKLSKPDKETVQSHLKGCAYCRDRVEDLQVFYQPSAVEEVSYKEHRKGLGRRLSQLTWKAYLQAAWSRKRQELGLLFQKLWIPRYSFAALTMLLGLFLWFNFTGIQEESASPSVNLSSISMEQPQESNNDWKKVEDKYGLGLDYDFLLETGPSVQKIIREGRFYMILSS